MILFDLPAPSRSCPAARGKHGEAGFGMLEVLVSLVIILLGMLGLAGLIVRSNQAEFESYQRVQAVMLVQDMVDRLNANRKNAPNYVTASPRGGPAGTAEEDCTGKTGANLDLCQWHNALLGAGEKMGTDKVGAMIDARGCVNYGGIEVAGAGTGVYTVSVVWRGLAATATAPSGILCGKDLYTDEKLRRVVTATVRIGKLGI